MIQLKSNEIINLVDTLDLGELEDLYSWVSGYEFKPVSIEEFVKGDEFLGPYFQGSLYPFWQERLMEIYPSPFYSPYFLVALRGGIGLGKTTIAAVGVCYDLYKLLCLTNPQRTLGLIESTKIIFSIFNVTLSLATDVIWDQLTQIFTASPFFSRLMGPLNTRRKDRDTLFPKRVDFSMGSRIGHSLGKAVYCLTGDTIIPLLDGRELPLKELVDKVKSGEDITVYSRDNDRKELVPGKVTNAACAGMKSIFKLTLDNGAILRGSSNHPILMRDNEYKTIGDIVVGDEIMPFDRNIATASYIHNIVSKEFTGYEDVYDITVDKYHNFATSSGFWVHNSAIMDEANFDVLNDQVYKSFNSLLRRMESRFLGTSGVPGKIWVVSSETDKFSTVNRIVDNYSKTRGVYVVQEPLWTVKAHKYGDKLNDTFPVYKGSESRSPTLLKEDDPVLFQDPTNVIQVPMIHYDSFDADVNNSLRDLAGIPAGSDFKLFTNPERLSAALCVSMIFPEVITLDFDNDDDQLINYCKTPSIFKNSINPNCPRYIHIDIGLTGDKLGIACSYISGFKERTSRDIHTFKDITELVPEIVTEWCFAVQPTPGKQVPLFKIRTLIQWMSEQGYLIAGMSCDGFQCLTGDTKISLLDGTEVPIKDLVGRDEFWVYSSDKDGNVVPGKGINARKTGDRVPVIKIILDNDKEITCTYNHKFLLKDGSYKEAHKLTAKDSLMTFSKEDIYIVSMHAVAYEDVYDIEVEEYHNFALSSGIFVHNSADMLQQFQHMGYKAELLSMDRTSDQYLKFRNAVNENRHKMPISALLKKELSDLMMLSDGGKVDHPPASSKDLADAVGGSVNQAILYANSHKLIAHDINDLGIDRTDNNVTQMFGWNE